VSGYEGLMAAQQCVPNNEARDKFAAEYSLLATIWEALSPDPVLNPYETDYRWLTQVYESVKPPSGNGKLLWHALGAKTVDLINQNVHLEAVRDDLETLVLDAQVLNEILHDADAEKKGREVEIKLIARLRKHPATPPSPPSANGWSASANATSRASSPAWSSSSKFWNWRKKWWKPSKPPTPKKSATRPKKP
jgi:type I restriction enzyme R subunit